MTQEQIVVLAVRGAIATLPKEQQEKVLACYAAIRSTVDEAGGYGVLALTLASAEMAAEK